MTNAERQLVWISVFQFPKSGGERESVVWRKYAVSEDDVHKLGCERERLKRENKPNWQYLGFVTARAGDVRDRKTVRRHGFAVEHKPCEGIHHAEIRLVAAEGTTMTSAEKTELRMALEGIFGPLARHTCVAA